MTTIHTIEPTMRHLRLMRPSPTITLLDSTPPLTAEVDVDVHDVRTMATTRVLPRQPHTSTLADNNARFAIVDIVTELAAGLANAASSGSSEDLLDPLVDFLELRITTIKEPPRTIRHRLPVPRSAWSTKSWQLDGRISGVAIPGHLYLAKPATRVHRAVTYQAA